MCFFSKYILATILVMVFLFSGFTALAGENLEEICEWEKIKDNTGNLSDDNYELLLKKCQDYYQEKSNEIEKDINRTEQEKDTLKNKIYILGNKVKNLDYQIYQGNIIIKDLNIQIKDTAVSIDESSLEINNIKKHLINLLQLRYEEDQKSYLEIFLAEKNLSAFFDDLMALEALNEETQRLLENVKALKSSLEGQKKSMDTEKDNLESVVAIQTVQKKENTNTEKTQESFLKMTEIEYQKYLKEQEQVDRNEAEITARIFEMIGTSEKLNFGQAYKVAKPIELITGIRSSFLLAIIAQESMNKGEFGGNVGQCYLKNTKDGSGVVAYNGKFVSRVMKPSRDVQPFLSITKELARDPFKTPVSCPMSYGYGGAMGPAQFIPSTWVMYRGGVKAITGKPANPWDIKIRF